MNTTPDRILVLKSSGSAHPRRYAESQPCKLDHYTFHQDPQWPLVFWISTEARTDMTQASGILSLLVEACGPDAALPVEALLRADKVQVGRLRTLNGTLEEHFCLDRTEATNLAARYAAIMKLPAKLLEIQTKVLKKERWGGVDTAPMEPLPLLTAHDGPIVTASSEDEGVGAANPLPVICCHIGRGERHCTNEAVYNGKEKIGPINPKTNARAYCEEHRCKVCPNKDYRKIVNRRDFCYLCEKRRADERAQAYNSWIQINRVRQERILAGLEPPAVQIPSTESPKRKRSDAEDSGEGEPVAKKARRTKNPKKDNPVIPNVPAEPEKH